MKKTLLSLTILVTAVGLLAIPKNISTEKFELQNFNSSYSTTENNSSLNFEAELLNKTPTSSSPAIIRMSLRTENNFNTRSGPYPPFSVPEADKQDSNYSINLWSNGYKDSRLAPNSPIPFRQVAINKHWKNKSITREYELRVEETFENLSLNGNPLPEEELRIKKGRYVINESILYSFNHNTTDEYKQLNYKIEFEVT